MSSTVETPDEKKTTPKTALSSVGIEYSRVEGYRVLPEDLVLVGRDPGTKVGDYGYDVRVHRPPMPSMIANIDAVGVIQAVLVTKIDNRLIVRMGRGRVINAREVNKKRAAEGRPLLTIKIQMVDKGTTQAQLDAMSVAENVLREEETGIDLIDKLYDFTQKYGEDEHQLMFDAMGITAERADELLKVREAIPELRKALKEKNYQGKKIGLEAVISLAKLSITEQKEALDGASNMASAAQQATISNSLARSVSSRARVKSGSSEGRREKVTLSNTEWRILYNYMEEHGWPGNPRAVPLIGLFIGKNKSSDIDGFDEVLKSAMKWSQKKKEKPAAAAATKKTPQKSSSNKGKK
jgi:hypothetical protein